MTIFLRTQKNRMSMTYFTQVMHLSQLSHRKNRKLVIVPSQPLNFNLVFQAISIQVTNARNLSFSS